MCEREADAVPFRFRGEEGNEDALQITRLYAFACVLNLDHRPGFSRDIVAAAAPHSHASLLCAFINRFDGVAQDVKQGLPQHALVCADFWKLAFNFELY